MFILNNIIIILEALGGLGIFLIGMIIMTEGLRNIAGDYLRSYLMTFTKSPLTGALTGAFATAVLQSSSATTVAAIGFVSAQIITFPQALGIIFGANIGTTITGWMVALFGFKFKLGSAILPLIFTGALLRLFTRGRTSQIGYALAGFGLIFVGITIMQDSMSGLQTVLSFENFPSDSLFSRLVLVVFGMIFTMITQSSSAGVAAALTALYSDIIIFEQAAAIVIGMDIGTTFTAIFATIGGSVNTKRTGFSHLIYNLFTGIGALILINPFIYTWELFNQSSVETNAEIALVAFHTIFNTLGVIAVVPFTRHFSGLIIRLFPETDSVFKKQLDNNLLSDPLLALNALQASLKIQFESLLSNIITILTENKNENETEVDDLLDAIDESQYYCNQIIPEKGSKNQQERLIEIIHSIDHMQRLTERFEDYEENPILNTGDSFLREECTLLIENIQLILKHLESKNWNNAHHCSRQLSTKLHETVKPFRRQVISRIGSGEISHEAGYTYLTAIRWLRRTAKHIDRINQHLGHAFMITGKQEES